MVLSNYIGMLKIVITWMCSAANECPKKKTTVQSWVRHFSPLILISAKTPNFSCNCVYSRTWISRKYLFKYLLNYFDCFDLNKRVSFVERKKNCRICKMYLLNCLKKDLRICPWEMPLKMRELYLKTIFEL